MTYNTLYDFQVSKFYINAHKIPCHLNDRTSLKIDFPNAMVYHCIQILIKIKGYDLHTCILYGRSIRSSF